MNADLATFRIAMPGYLQVIVDDRMMIAHDFVSVQTILYS
jgi:hypothetical protein